MVEHIAEWKACLRCGYTQKVSKNYSNKDMLICKECEKLLNKNEIHLEARLASARAIMLKFVGKVDRGMAKSVETYAEMKAWLEE